MPRQLETAAATAPRPDPLVTLRAALSGLVLWAGAEEALLLQSVRAGVEPGHPTCWSATATVAHNSEFRSQQVIRLQAVAEGVTPPEFPQVDHTSAEVYDRYGAASLGEALASSRTSSAALVDALGTVEDADLLDPSRHPFLDGRLLWLQVVVRGFWHPCGHIGEYFQRHGRPGRAIDLHAHALSTARYLHAPHEAVGMASYSLACARAAVGDLESAAATIGEAIALNPDLRQAAARDPDLAGLRAAGHLDVAVA